MTWTAVTRRVLFPLIVLAGVVVSPPLRAEAEPFSHAAFTQAQQDGSTIVVDIYAEWCVTCRRQQAILSELFREPAFAKVVHMRVDYDRPGDALKFFKANSRSTLIVFKGTRETGRVSFDTDPKRIRALVESGL